MKVQEQIKNVRKYSLFFDNLYYDNGTALFGKNGLIFEKIIGHDVSEDFIFAFETINGKTYTHLLNDKINDFFEFPFSATLTNSKFGIYWSDFNLEDFSVSQNLFDIEKKMFIKKLKGTEKKSLELLVGDSIYFQDLKRISVGSFHLPTETTLWQYSVADLGAEKVSKILGVFGQTLAVVGKMPVYPEHILIGIDINDGKLRWSVNLPQSLMHSNLFYYEQNNSIISLRRNFLWEFSLSSMEVIREKQLPETFKYNSLNVQVELASLYGDLIYFAGKDLENVRPSALVGVFDLKTEKLVDVHDLQSDGKFTVGGNSRPQVSGNKIYVQDTKNTLHILERESDALNEQG